MFLLFVNVNNFFGLTQLRQHPDTRAGLEITEIDDVQARNNLFEFRKMSLENRIKHEEDIKLLYLRALETGDYSAVLNKAMEKDPFEQLYWCMLTITADKFVLGLVLTLKRKAVF